jgi:hypothetical protein
MSAKCLHPARAIIRNAAVAGLVVTTCFAFDQTTESQAAPSLSSINEDNWSLNYAATADDGVSISSASYKGTQAFYLATMPYIPVEYDDGGLGLDELTTAFLDDFYKVDLNPSGFRIEAVYVDVSWPSCGSYKYVQRWDFYADGRFLPTLWIQGPGKVVDHTYHVRIRLDHDIAGASSDFLDRWEQGQWYTKNPEHPYWDDDLNDPNGYEWRLRDSSRGFTMGSTDPGANITELRYHAGQQDYEGQEEYYFTPPHPGFWDNNESISGYDLVAWYNTTRALSNGPASCATTSMVPGPFSIAFGY